MFRNCRRAVRTFAAVSLTMACWCSTGLAAGESGFREPAGALSLADAYEAALGRSPELRAGAEEVRARNALARQAKRRPNPTVHTEVENIGIRGGRAGLDETETTLLLSQLIELGAKRERRTRVAELGRELAEWDLEAKRLDVMLGVRKAFVAVLAAQTRVDLAESRGSLATKELAAATESVRAGASSPADLSRARLTLERARLDTARTRSELATARDALAATWGGTTARFTRAEGRLSDLPRLPREDDLLELVPSSPEVARWSSEREERKAALALEQAEVVPDVTAGIGARHFHDGSDQALVFEMSVPLPLFDRNADAVAAARARLSKADHEAAAATAEARREIHDAYQRSVLARANAASLAATTMPAARAAHRDADAAFRAGALRRIDVLESERAIFELESDYVTALEAAHLADAELERLTAAGLAGERIAR